MGTACEFVLLSLKQLETVLSKIYTEMIQSMSASIIRLVMLIFGRMEVQCKFSQASVLIRDHRTVAQLR